MDSLHKAVLFSIQRGAEFLYLTPNYEFNDVVRTIEQRLNVKPYVWILKHIDNQSNSLSYFLGLSGLKYPEITSDKDQPKYELGLWKRALVQKAIHQGELTVSLSNKGSSTLFNLESYRDERAPPVILSTAESELFIKENILFHYDSFWAIGVLEDNDHIWSMWLQRLLREIGNFVSFAHVEKRISNSSVCKSKYNHSNEMLTNVFNQILTWTCDDEDFFSCVGSLSLFMSKHQFITYVEYTVIKSWLNDLRKSGYKVPSMRQKPTNQESLEPVHKVAFQPVINSPTLQYDINFDHMCSTSLPNCPYSDVVPIRSWDNILLVIVFNTDGHYHVIRHLESIYRPFFKNIIYCGTNVDASISFPISFIEMGDDFSRGEFGYQCLQNAMRMNYDVEGYLHLSDDVLLNVWSMHNLQTDKVWFQKSMRVANLLQSTVPDVWRNPTWWPWESSSGKVTLHKAIQHLRKLSEKDEITHVFLNQLALNSGSNNAVFYEVSDIFYIPSRLSKQFQFLVNIFDGYGVYLEITVPTIINGLDKQDNIVRLQGSYLWYEDRVLYKDTFNYSDVFLHPVKLGPCLLQDECKRFLCNKYLPCLF
ncbi:hypothetical protein SNE40_001555 [Patella caerulea]|uniref:Uncharacterized protein n=1 Tax=Patella caerulea TaxID=87958 RepID=A0AAN8KE71_PATCE